MDFFDASAASLALTGAVLTVVTLGLISPFWLVVRRIYPGRNVFFARWGFLDVGRVVLLGVFVSFFAGRLFGFIENELLRSLAMMLLIFGCMSGLCLRIAMRKEPSGVQSLGFRSEGTARAIGAGLFLYLATLPGVLGLFLMAPWWVELGGGEWEVQSMLPQFLELAGTERVLSLVGMVLLVPVLEELLFRGFLQPLLVQNLREPGGIAATSLLFAVLHGGSAFLPIFGLSLVLGTLKLRTQRLAACCCVHALHNGIVLFLVSRYPELATY